MWIERFWGSLKNEMIHHRRYATRADAESAIREYIEIFCNRQRRNVLFVSWNDMAWSADALERLDQDRRSAGAAGAPALLGRADQYLMREVKVDWAPGKTT